MRTIVFDIETTNFFTDTGSTDPVSLDMSCVCIYDYETDTYLSFTKETLKDLWPIFEKADMFITYNGDHFDIPILNKYYSGDLTKIKSLDLLKEVRNSLGRRLKLDSLAEATLGRHKTGHGSDANVWWREGLHQKVIDYCIEDVRITKDIYEYALKHKTLKYMDGKEPKEIAIDTANWDKKEESGITFTLPF